MATTIYHNPRCSKSRATLALLEERGIEAEVIKYLETPPTANELKTILDQLGATPQEIIRFGEAAAKEAGISAKDDRSVDEWISLIVAEPTLLQRPIVVHQGAARIGRPPENILDIL